MRVHITFDSHEAFRFSQAKSHLGLAWVPDAIVGKRFLLGYLDSLVDGGKLPGQPSLIGASDGGKSAVEPPRHQRSARASIERLKRAGSRVPRKKGLRK